MPRVTRLRGTPLAVAALLLCGCGAATCRITGEVTYDGEPVKKGTITFTPADGKGQTVGGEVLDGRYRVEIAVPGPKLVKVEAVKEVPFARSSEEMARLHAARKAKDDGSGLIDPADLIPPNAEGNNTTVELTLGEQRFDFRLKKPARRP
jgi:hypothetical protein